MAKASLHERLAVLEENSKQSLEILKEIHEYTTKVELHEHRLRIVENHCSACDLGERLSNVERAVKWVKGVATVCLAIATGFAVELLWGWWGNKGG